MEHPHTINIDGNSYDVTQFSRAVQQAVMIYNKFSAQLQDQQLEVMKTQAALQQVGQQITEAVKKELEDKKADGESKKEHEPNGADGDPQTVQ